ncbi:diadenylate cyclase [Virgibacillus dokdonensis]|uniref:diadenylate cyclase n=1 Tax=Virgibacillus dokdonensis TaxID=302167 RepID=UPI00159184BE
MIAIERKQPLEPLIHSETSISAKVSHALLESIFYPGSILHDEAVLKEIKLSLQASFYPYKIPQKKSRDET